MNVEMWELLITIVNLYGTGAFVYWIVVMIAPENPFVKFLGIFYKPAFDLFSFAKLKIGQGYIDLTPICINIVITIVVVPAIRVLYRISIGG